MSYIRIKGVTKTYGEVGALDDFSVEIDRGEILALVGPDGAGKTSLMRILCNLLIPDAGEIRMGEVDLLNDFKRVKEQFGYMPQVFSLYPDLSVKENLTFYGGIYGLTGARFRDKCEELYRFSNLKQFASRRAGNLSGGMKQKLALSCALIHNPEVLVLDEPTTGVDPLSRRQFWEILAEFRRRGVTVFVSTPYMDEVARADRACFIMNGEKLAEGTPSELTALFRGTIYSLDRPPQSSLVKSINGIDHVQARRFGSGLHLHLAEEASLSQISEDLSRLGIDRGELTPAAPDLEDCFIQLMESPS